MQRHSAIAATVLVLLGCSTGPEPGPQPYEEPKRKADPRVDDILRAVSARLSESQQLSFHATISYEMVETLDDEATTDVKIQYGGRTDFIVSRPDRLRVSYRGDRERREFFLDREAVTMLAPDENVYATMVSPGTIEGALDALWDKAGVAPPLSDFVYRDPYARLEPEILRVDYIGLHPVNGVPCHHIFVAQNTTDWQVWVDAGEDPLLRKIVITYRELPQAPVFVAVFGGWDFESSPAPDTFRFEPPEGAIQVEAVVTPFAGPSDGEVP